MYGKCSKIANKISECTKLRTFTVLFLTVHLSPKIACNADLRKRDIAVRRGFSLIGSCVEDQISEISIFKFLLHFPLDR